MDAQLPGSPVSSAKSAEWRALCATILAPAGLTVLWLLALLLLMRRLSGSLTAPLDTPLLLTTGWMFFAFGVGVRACWKQSSTQGPLRRSLVFMAVAILPLVINAAVLTLPDSPPLGVGLLWLLVGGSAAWSIYAEWTQRVGQRPVRQSAPLRPKPHSRKPVETPLADSFSEPLAGDLLQQLTRMRAADGSERVAGKARAEFQAGQRHASLHISFCPPFEMTPELDVEQLDGPQSRIKVGQLQPFGARLDIRLSRPETEPQSIVLQFEARGSLESDVQEQSTSPRSS